MHIGEQSPPARAGKSPYPPGMQVDPDRLDLDMGRMQLNDLDCTPPKIDRHPQPYPPGMNNSVRYIDLVLADLQISDQGDSSATAPVSNGNPHPPGMGSRHAFPHGREDM